MFKKRDGVLWFAAMMSVLFVSLSATGTEAQQPKGIPSQVTIVSGPMGGGWMASAAYISDQLMKKFPKLSSTCIPGAAVGNLTTVNRGRDAQIAICTYADSFYNARAGKLPKPVDVSNVKLVATYNSGLISIHVKADSNIHSIKDLKGKRVLPGMKSFGPEPIFRDILKRYGMSYDDMKISHVTYGDMPTLMKDGHADAYITTASGGRPHSVSMDIETVFPVRVLGLEKNVMDGVLKDNHPYLSKMTIPAGFYKGQTQPVDVLNILSIIAVNKNLSDEFIYEFTKMILENSGQIRKSFKVVDMLGPNEVGLTGILTTDLHPGALRYWKEIGVVK